LWHEWRFYVPKTFEAVFKLNMDVLVYGVVAIAIAKIVRNGFELWVDIPELAIAI